jgi:hypothetical protein
MPTHWRVWCVLLLVSRAAGAEGERDKKVTLYTNDDLERVSPRRGETGGSMPPVAAAPAPAPDRKPEGQGEEYWRREAERLQDRLEPLRARLADLRARIEERRRQPGVKPYSDPRVEAWRRRLAALEERMRDMEDRFLTRARRAGALPGWLR